MKAEAVEISQRMGSISIESIGDSGGNGGDHGGWVTKIPSTADDTEAGPESVIDLPEASDAVSDTTDSSISDNNDDGVGPSGSRCTKKTLVRMILLTTMAFIGVTIGLGVGLGTRKRSVVTSSVSSAAHNEVTLEECLAEAAAEEKNAKMQLSEEPKDVVDVMDVMDVEDAVPSVQANDNDNVIDQSSSISNDIKDIVPEADESNDGVELIMAGSAVIGGTPSDDGMGTFLKASLRRASNDDGMKLTDGSARRRRNLSAGLAKTRRMQQCADLLKEAGASG